MPIYKITEIYLVEKKSFMFPEVTFSQYSQALDK